MKGTLALRDAAAAHGALLEASVQTLSAHTNMPRTDATLSTPRRQRRQQSKRHTRASLPPASVARWWLAGPGFTVFLLSVRSWSREARSSLSWSKFYSPQKACQICGVQ
jgi:hypothetical protein